MQITVENGSIFSANQQRQQQAGAMQQWPECVFSFLLWLNLANQYFNFSTLKPKVLEYKFRPDQTVRHLTASADGGGYKSNKSPGNNGLERVCVQRRIEATLLHAYRNARSDKVTLTLCRGLIENTRVKR